MAWKDDEQGTNGKAGMTAVFLLLVMVIVTIICAVMMERADEGYDTPLFPANPWKQPADQEPPPMRP